MKHFAPLLPPAAARALLLAAIVASLCVGSGPWQSARAAVSLVLTDNDASPQSAMLVPGGTITLTLNLVSTAEQTIGLDYFLEVSASTPGGSGFFTLTNRSLAGSTYNDPYFDNATVTMTPGSILNPRNDSDLGALVSDFNNPNGAGTFFVANLTLSLSASLPPGTYRINTFSVPGTGYVTPSFTESDFNSQASFDILVVPEPAAWQWLAGALGVGALGRWAQQRRRQSQRVA